MLVSDTNASCGFVSRPISRWPRTMFTYRSAEAITSICGSGSARTGGQNSAPGALISPGLRPDRDHLNRRKTLYAEVGARNRTAKARNSGGGHNAAAHYLVPPGSY